LGGIHRNADSFRKTGANFVLRISAPRGCLLFQRQKLPRAEGLKALSHKIRFGLSTAQFRASRRLAGLLAASFTDSVVAGHEQPEKQERTYQWFQAT
jgi:hypothetical protein